MCVTGLYGLTHTYLNVSVIPCYRCEDSFNQKENYKVNARQLVTRHAARPVARPHELNVVIFVLWFDPRLFATPLTLL